MSSKAVEELINSATKIISSNISRIKNSGGDYNTFSVLGVERDEVFTHSQIIYSFLNLQCCCCFLPCLSSFLCTY